MYEITIENKRGEQLKLTQNKNYITTATGLSPVHSNIITASVANYGGERFVSSRLLKRNIVLTVYINAPVETNRIALYHYVKSHDFIRVYIKNGSRSVYIDGYVESFEADLFTKSQTAQISIICPKPQFIDMQSNNIPISCSVGNMSFPFWANDDNPIFMGEYSPDTARLIVNQSDDDTGFIYQMYCYDTVTDPMIYLEETDQFFRINKTFRADSVITISTVDGNKYCKLDIRGAVTNIINDVDGGSCWFKLLSGYNHILQSAESGLSNLSSNLIYTNEYGGV